MCTLMTFSREFWKANRSAVIAQIHEDSKGNGDGWALIAVGTNQEATSILRSKRLESILETLEEGWWERVWIHARHATGNKKGLAQTHGWSANDWYIMHNGILRHKDTHKFDVDSMVLIPLLEKYGLSAAVAYCQENESFCNLLLVNPEEGKWYVGRNQAGSLYTDGDGTYSSREFASVNTAVPVGHSLIYTVENFKKKVETSYHSTGAGYTPWSEGKRWNYKEGRWEDDDVVESKVPDAEKNIALVSGSKPKGKERKRWNSWAEKDEHEEDRLRAKYGLPMRTE